MTMEKWQQLATTVSNMTVSNLTSNQQLHLQAPRSCSNESDMEISNNSDELQSSATGSYSDDDWTSNNNEQ